MKKRPSSRRVFLLLASLFIPLILLTAILFAVGRAQAEPLAPHGTLSGTVITPDGSPPGAEATVDMGILDEWGGCCTWVDSATADSVSGTFGFDLSALPQGVIPGDLYLRADPPDGSPLFHSLWMSVYVNSATEVTDVGTLTLTYASFAGMVYEPDGVTPAASGNLGVFDANPDVGQVAGGGYLSGTYAVGAVPDGEHRLVAFPPDDSIFWHSEPYTATINPGSQYISGTTQQVSLTLRSSNVTGTVILPGGTPAGWVVSGTEQILGQAWVDAVEEVGGITMDRPTDSTGDFGFLLEDTHYWMHARPEGTLSLTYTPSIPQFAAVSGTLDTGPLTLTYPTVRGVVFDPMDNPVEGCMNVWLEDEFGQWVVDTWHCSGPAGDPFQLGGVTAGDYWLRADAPDGTDFLPSDPMPVNVAPGSQYQFTDTQIIDPQLNQTQVSVAVTDPSGQPITASVMLHSDWGDDLWEKSYPGQPATFGGLDDSHYRVVAWPMESDIPGLANSQERDVFLGSAGPVALTLTLQTPSIIGTVVLPDSQPLPPTFDEMDQPIHPAVVQAHNGDWSVDTWIMTNIEGQFALALPDGHFALRAYPEGTLAYTYTKSVRRPISITNTGAPQDLGAVRLTHPRIEGVVVDSGGMRVSTEVHLWQENDNYWDTDDTLWFPPDVDEPFRFGGLSMGIYYIQADPPADDSLGHGPSNIYSFQVMGITNTEVVTLQLKPANFVGEVLFSGAGDCPYCPVPGVHARLRDDAWTFEEWAKTDEMGKFAFSGLGPGNYVVDLFLGDDLAVDWDPPLPESFTLLAATDQVTGTLYLQPAPHNKHVVGEVVYEGGAPITDTNSDGTGDVLVTAYHASSGRSVATTTDPFDGSYEFHLGGGDWAINVEPTHPDIDWSIDPRWTEWASFNLDETLPETQTVVFTATHAVYHEVFGWVEDPYGNPPPLFSTWVDLCTDEGHCFGSPVEASGAFTVTLLPGTYELWVRVDPATGFLPPSENLEFR